MQGPGRPCMEITSGYVNGRKSACPPPHKQDLRAATAGSGITQHEGDTSLLIRLFLSVFDRVSNHVDLSCSLRSRF